MKALLPSNRHMFEKGRGDPAFFYPDIPESYLNSATVML
jgi:hypothetical protein